MQFITTSSPKNTFFVESIEQGFLNKAAEFNVDTSDAGRGVLTASGRGPREPVNVNVNDMGNSLYKVSFLPTEPGEYVIQLYFNGKEIGSSPFTTTVADPGKAVAHGEGTHCIRYVKLEIDQQVDIEISVFCQNVNVKFVPCISSRFVPSSSSRKGRILG